MQASVSPQEKSCGEFEDVMMENPGRSQAGFYVGLFVPHAGDHAAQTGLGIGTSRGRGDAQQRRRVMACSLLWS